MKIIQDLLKDMLRKLEVTICEKSSDGLGMRKTSTNEAILNVDGFDTKNPLLKVGVTDSTNLGGSTTQIHFK